MAVSANALEDQSSERCPFLSHTLNEPTACRKSVNARGVCTISASSNGARQDWLVCPYRALDDNLLTGIIQRLYSLPSGTPVMIRPARALGDAVVRAETLLAAQSDDPQRVFIYFQDFLGGEIGLSGTSASPEISFDITVVELLAADPDLMQLGKYGIIELQTTDTHGSYMHAVAALRNALDLHGEQFPQHLARNPEWAGRKMEGPNISNVFKRTFYQIAFKFQVTKRDTSAGCVLALPQPVWDSWQPFLGAPELHEQPDGTWRLLDDDEAHPTDWIYVFDVNDVPAPNGRPAPLTVRLVIGTDAATLSRAAFDIAPARAVGYAGSTDAVVSAIIRRLGSFIPGVGVRY